MLGLAAGTDGLGAAFQAAGLVVALLGVMAFAKTQADQLFAVLLVVACPVMATLITAQKPQLLPAAALTIALVILVQRFKMFDLPTALLAFGCAAFAMASKHSFLLTGSVVVFVGLVAAVRAQRLPLALLVLAGCFSDTCCARIRTELCLLWRPHLAVARTVATGRRSGGHRICRRSLREVSVDRITLGKLARLPWDLVVTLKPRLLHDVLGLGVFGFLLAFRERGPTRQLLLAALAAFALIVAFAPAQSALFSRTLPVVRGGSCIGAVGVRSSRSFSRRSRLRQCWLPE